MKICVITPLYHPTAIGGRERIITMLVSEFIKKYDVSVITTKSVEWEGYMKEPKVKIIEINPKNVGSPYEMLTDSATHMTFKKLLWHFFDIWNISSYFQIKKAIKSVNPDLIFINGIKGLSSSVFSAVKKSKLPQIYMIHDFELISRWSDLYRNGKVIKKFNFFEYLLLKIIRKKTSSLSAIISPSKFLMDFHLKYGFFKNSKQFIVPNGTILKDDAKVRDGAGGEFLFLGQVVEHKGPQIAVEAIKKVKDKKVKLHVVGKGAYLDELKKIAGNDDRIIFYGYLNEENLNEIFDRCSYLVLPSLWQEIFGLVAIEALSKGLPVIASNIGAIPEIIKDGQNGFLFPPGDVDYLAEIIKKVTNDEKILLPLSKNSISSARNFKFENQANIIQDILEKTNQSYP